MIDVSNLSKDYRVARREQGVKAAVRQFIKPEYSRIQALSNVSFHISPGEIVGYMGPNGAGKSTTIKIMSGILRPSSGHCTVNGRVPWKDRRAHVSELGVVFGQRSQLWWDTPVVDSFELLKHIYKVEEPHYLRKMGELSEALDLKPLLHTPVRQLSLGQRMRCEVAASLIHSPKLIFLDEPTIGLDSVSKLGIRKFIQHMNETEQLTVILTTHDTTDLEALCKRVMLIGKGKLLYDGGFEEMKQSYASEKTLKIYLEKPITLAPQDWCLESGEVISRQYNPKHTTVKQLLEDLNGLDIADIEVTPQPVDELIAKMYKEHAI